MKALRIRFLVAFCCGHAVYHGLASIFFADHEGCAVWTFSTPREASTFVLSDEKNCLRIPKGTCDFADVRNFWTFSTPREASTFVLSDEKICLRIPKATCDFADVRNFWTFSTPREASTFFATDEKVSLRIPKGTCDFSHESASGTTLLAPGVLNFRDRQISQSAKIHHFLISFKW